MKKITAFIICLSIVSGMCAPAYALEPLYTKEEWEKIQSGQDKTDEETNPPGTDAPLAGEDGKSSDQNGSIAGDIDADGDIDVTDLASLALYLLGDMSFTEEQNKTADVDDDGDVTLADLAKYRQFLSKKIPYLTEPETVTDPVTAPSPDDKPSAPPSDDPVIPAETQPVSASGIDAVKKLIKSGDVSIYQENLRQRYKDVYDRFNEDGYIIQVVESTEDDGIKYAEGRDVALMPYAKYEDIGVLYNVVYKGNNYSVFVYSIDPQYKGQFASMAEYYELRIGSMGIFEEVDFKTIIGHSPLRDNGTEIISYSLVNYTDKMHYCRVRTTASDEEYAEFMEKLQLRRNYLSTPLMMITDRDEKGNKTYHLINEDGYRYSCGVVMFKPLPDDNVLLKNDWFYYIYSLGEKDLYIEDKVILGKIAAFSEYAASINLHNVIDTKVTSEDKSEYTASILFTKGNGMTATPALFTRSDGKYYIADDEKIQSFVRNMTEAGYIDGTEYFEALERKETVPEDSETEEKTDAAALKEKYPHYFELTHSKGIEVYVWQIAENVYRCGLMSGTNRNKTEDEIHALQSSPLTIAEAKVILNELNVKKDNVFPYAITQPDSPYSYEVDEEYRNRVWALFR